MKVLIIRCGALGDLVYATSVIDALKSEFGEDTIVDFVSTPGTAKLFEKDHRVHHIYPLKHKKIPIIISKDKKEIIKNSKNAPYDLLINFESGKQFKSLIKAIHAKRKVGAQLNEISLNEESKHMVDVTKSIFKSVVSKDVYEKSFPRLMGTDKEECKKKIQPK